MQWTCRPPAFASMLLVALMAAGCGSTSAGAGSIVGEPPADDGLSMAAPSLRVLSRDGESTSLAALEVRRAVPVPADLDVIVPPCQPLEVMSDFWDCRGRRRHRGLDLAGVGEDAGLGSSIVAIARSRIVEIGRPEDDPGRYGRPLTRGTTTERGGMRLPISREIEGYGRVRFFTSSYGSSRTGAIVVTDVLDGPLQGHRVRYMHLGAVRPDLAPGSIVDSGEEIGLMGGTAIQESRPHVHIDVEDPQGRRVDLAPYLGLPSLTEGEAPRCGR